LFPQHVQNWKYETGRKPIISDADPFFAKDSHNCSASKCQPRIDQYWLILKKPAKRPPKSRYFATETVKAYEKLLEHQIANGADASEVLEPMMMAIPRFHG